MLWFFPHIDGRFRILPLPCLLLLKAEESHLWRSSLNASIFFNHLHVLIDLHLVQHSFLVFAVSLCKTYFVLQLDALDVVAEVAIEQRAVCFKERELLVEVRRVQS